MLKGYPRDEVQGEIRGFAMWYKRVVSRRRTLFGHEDLMRFTNYRVSSLPIRLPQLGPSSMVIVFPRLSFGQVATPCGA